MGFCTRCEWRYPDSESECPDCKGLPSVEEVGKIARGEKDKPKKVVGKGK